MASFRTSGMSEEVAFSRCGIASFTFSALIESRVTNAQAVER